MNQEKILQRIGEDTAYTFKGLHKTADILQFQYKLYLIVPIVFSIISLGFSNDLPDIVLKILAVIALVSTCCAIINQKEYEKITSYRKLADEYKKIYDETENYFHNNIFDKSEEIQLKKNILANKFDELTISKKAHCTTQNTIKEEMNLDWLKTEDGETK